MFDFIVWGIDPEIFAIGPIHVRWYGLLFASSFLIGHRLMLSIYKEENLEEKALDGLVIYGIVGTVIGARLGHCLFYEPEEYLAHPLRILEIWNGGLASHGAGIGIICALFLYQKKYKIKNFLWILDRVAMVVAIAGALIRFGNYMNSEIIGNPTNASTGVVFTREVQDLFNAYEDVMDISITKIDQITKVDEQNYQNLDLNISYSTAIYANQNEVSETLTRNLLPAVQRSARFQRHLKLIPDSEITFKVTPNKIVATIPALGLPRHPAQLYESFSCILLFGLLWAIYLKYKSETPNGLLFGIFCTWTFILRFFYEFIKEVQVLKELEMTLNIGQRLSIPLVIIGLFFIVRSFLMKKKQHA